MDIPSNIGKYQIQGLLGRGGMGMVYRGFDPAIHRPVAIKTITKSDLDNSELQYALTRFRHEAQAVGRLTHTGIAAIYDYGEDMDIAYIVMELVQGKTLFEHLRDDAHFDLKEIGDIIRELLEGLAYAHAQGVVHRDVKTSNILINIDGHIKITDFGIARIESSTLTQVGDIMGSPGYMSPEQFNSADVDARSDIYSAGVIAYELLTGRRPFTGNNLEIMRQVFNDRPANPSTLNPEISVQLDWAVQKALAKKPEERFQTARAFADAFTKGIQASIRQAMAHASAPQEDAPTQKIDANLLTAALMLSGKSPLAAPPATPASAPVVADAPTLPGGHPAAAAPSTQDSATTDTISARPRILFVDDEERILTGLRSIFRMQYRVFTATNGAEALDIVNKFKPHVVVSDQRMPSMTGVELLRQVKDALPRTVRILLTGYSDLAAIVGSVNDGEVFRFISKPWDTTELQKIIADAVAIGVQLAEAAAAPAAPPQISGAVLVVEREEQTTRAVKELLGHGYKVLRAANMDDAFTALAEEEVAVILADIENAGDDVIPTFKVLKQEHPEILTIVLTAGSDSELVIELINQAQIFRFLVKPINLKRLNEHVQAAFAKYATFKQSPELTRQHQVAQSKKEDAGLTARLLDRVKSVKSWFRRG